MQSEAYERAVEAGFQCVRSDVVGEGRAPRSVSERVEAWVFGTEDWALEASWPLSVAMGGD
jgi:hypothetical protein